MKDKITRKDSLGRNSVFSLRYFEGFYNLTCKGYLNCNIMERITIRAAYCGIKYPSIMIKELINSNINI